MVWFNGLVNDDLTGPYGAPSIRHNTSQHVLVLLDFSAASHAPQTSTIPYQPGKSPHVQDHSVTLTEGLGGEVFIALFPIEYAIKVLSPTLAAGRFCVAFLRGVCA